MLKITNKKSPQPPRPPQPPRKDKSWPTRDGQHTPPVPQRPPNPDPRPVKK